MDKNTVTGFILIALVLIGFSWYSQPSAEQAAELARQQDSIAQVEEQVRRSSSTSAPQRAVASCSPTASWN